VASWEEEVADLLVQLLIEYRFEFALLRLVIGIMMLCFGIWLPIYVVMKNRELQKNELKEELGDEI
jgi:hypothetical protein